MKYYKIFLLLSFLLLAFNFSTAQPVEAHTKLRYSEVNGGVLFGGVFINNDQIGPLIYPGVSFLWGKTHYFKNRFIVDSEIGLALPVIFTAKIGAGIAFEKVEFLMGLRALPPNYYVQINAPTQRGTFLFSIENNIFKGYIRNNITSFQLSKFTLTPPSLINIGYRWNKF